MKLRKTFLASKVNRSTDERLLPDGQLVDMQNVRINSSEDGEGGSAENVVSNLKLTDIKYNGQTLSSFARCIKAFPWPKTETIFWFVTDPSLGVDMILSYKDGLVRYHIVSTSVLNFSPTTRINGVDLIDDLLFFTDNHNNPRVINITRNYLKPIGGVDRITEEDISVIVKPPVFAPTVTTVASSSGQSFMEDRFIRFGTRFRYQDGQYSAISSASQPAFVPGPFQLDYETYDMVGMLNIQRRSIIQFDTGDRQVTDVEVLFKNSHEPFWNTIERFNKDDQGWADNETRTIEFDRRKIFTTLPEAETLRNYDNVPRKALAQTTIGNRIFYGNYVEGYDIDTVLDFRADLIQQPINGTDLDPDSVDYEYTEFETNAVVGAGIEFDLSGVELKKGAVLFLDLNFESSVLTGDPTTTQNDFASNIGIALDQDYATVAEFYNSATFQNAIGGVAAQPIGSCSDGNTLDDDFNCSITTEPGWTYSATSGFIVQRIGNIIRLFPPVTQYTNGGLTAQEYFYNVASRAFFRELGNNTSCHSDRDFETAIVYMDGYGRETTALVSKNNVVSTPKNSSDKKNTIRVTIKHDPPSWAKYYKIVVKPSHSGYETIYSDIFFKDPRTGTWFVKLQGDNIQKASVGDRLIVKRDANDVNYGQDRTKILSLEAKEENFIDPNNSSGRQEPTGTYMEINGNFGIEEDEDSFVSYGLLSSATDASTQNPGSVERQGVPLENPEDSTVDYYRTAGVPPTGCTLAFPTYVNNGTLGARSYEEYDIPEGSTVRFYINHFREGSDDYFRYLFDEEFLATRPYDSLYDFIVGENVDFSIPSNDPEAESDTTTPTVDFNGVVGSSIFTDDLPTNTATGLMIQYTRVPGAGTDGQDLANLSFQSGPDRYFGRNTRLDVRVEVRRSTQLLVFETEPKETDGLTFYGNEQVFEIQNGWHQGNVLDQTFATDAIVDLTFFDCYSFGNGVESYKVRDSLSGRALNLGDRTYIATEEEYREQDRYADVTYSGVYNFESKLNKLNAFNAALLNFKPLDQNYGAIQVLDARQTDILTLQEDKISYILANGKDLFSDAAAGGAILNVPQVLGRQIARGEEFGISLDPESYARWGRNAFFTDSKRNAVIQLAGGVPEEELIVISDIEMRPWFRNLFRDSEDVFRIGSWDPFHNEYVISNTSERKAQGAVKTAAGVPIQGENTSKAQLLEVDLRKGVGDVSIDYEVGTGTVDLLVTYNGDIVINQPVTGSGSVAFDKDAIDVDTAVVSIQPTEASYELTVNEVEVDEMTIIKVATNSVLNAGDTVHTRLSVAKISPEAVSNLSSEEVVLMSGSEVGMYSSIVGQEGVGNIPANGELLVIQSRTEDGDTYEFVPGTDRFMYHYSDTLYSSEEVITTLRPLLKELVTVQNLGNGVYQTTLEYDNTGNNKYLYIVWDYYPQAPVEEDIGFDETTKTFDNTELTFDDNG